MSYQFNSIVNRTEAEALKEMIFNRVRERSQSISEDIQADVMDVARNSFVSDNNPFSNIIKPVENTNVSEKVPAEKVETTEVSEQGEIGFPVHKPQHQIFSQTRLLEGQYTEAAVADTMQQARAGLYNKQSFMGALEFLNSQAAVSLIRTRADKFEALA